MALETMKELFDEKISNILGKIHDQNENIHEGLRNIEEKVNKNENEMKEMNRNLLIMVTDNNKHYFSCPNTKQVDNLYDELETLKTKINTDFQDVKFFVRNPKTFFTLVAVGVAAVFIGYLELLAKVKDVDNRMTKKEYFYRDPNEPLIFRGGTSDPKSQIKPTK